ncbi:MAG: Ig-like domain-containing protein [Defluviitaleaceae bacterium]|nr:Ig-like domain-containing protein [Defluviitaleaceae bacterium]MCL2240793.1 Ig-like domain-containing protein [Defluviitaleaceae bacterium]
MKKLFVFIFAVMIFAVAGCGRGDDGGGEGVPYPRVDMTQMPLYIEGAPIQLAMSLGWQAALEVPKEGFILVPQTFGEMGVCVESVFVLTRPQGNRSAATDISIDGQPRPGVVRQREGVYAVTPLVPLSHNSLYTFRLVPGGGMPELTWTFQTTPAFALVHTLPAHEAVNVPVNTGIELTFSAAGHGDIRPHFSIEPPVEGRFIQRGATTVFMPRNPLAQGRVYTVTLSAGVGLAGTAEVLGYDISFSFETAAEDPAHHTWPEESFHFNSPYTELPSFEPPQVSFRVSYPHGRARPRVEIGVYRFGDEERAERDIQNLFTTPQWAWFAWRESRIDTAGMERVARMNITQAQSTDEWGWMETLVLPDALPPGFYVINARIGGEISDQMVLQITDLAVQVFADDDQTLVWVNDMTTGRPVENATVRDATRTGHTGRDGIATLVGGMGESADRLVVEAPDGKRVVLFYARHVQPAGIFRSWGGWWGMPTASEDYWTALQLDRTLFQRSDTLYFWGFAQHRSTPAQTGPITAVLTEGWNWARMGGGGAGDILHRQTVTAQRGSFHGYIHLPHLDPGAYILSVYHGDARIGSIHFEVQDYVKPPYELTLRADRRAVFMDEQITFTARTAFFEGTPVPGLRLSYGGWGWPVDFSLHSRTAVTDQDGEAEITVGPFRARHDAQGQGQITLTAEATLPEIGPTFRQHSVQVFVNDIDVQVRATREGPDATLSVSAHHITLERLNNDTAEHSGDFLCRPLARQTLNVDIVRVYWVAVRTGERYCFINRVVVPRYRHDRREQVIERFTLTTDTQGEASHDFTVPNRDGESYFARVSTTDGNGRRILHDVFVGRDWWSFWSNAESGEPFLDGARGWDEGYDIGEEVRLTVMSGTEKLEMGAFLFVIASGGIIEHRVSENPLVFTFDDAHLPNATVYAVHFNGHTYRSGWNMRQTLRFNHASRQLDIRIEACRDAYRPGEIATLTLRVTDGAGRPVEAHVNLAAVDEALFALRDFTPHTLRDLYRNIPSGVRHQVATHRTFASDGHDDVMWGGGTQQLVRRTAMATDAAAMPAPAAAPAVAESAMEPGGGDHIREIFEDTALFFSARTNSRGEATVTFTLPDNITSWRLTASGITETLYAGNATTNLIVTNPLFVHYTLNDVFLVGDTPVLGVNAFGTSLSGGERVTFEVWRDNGCYLGDACETCAHPLTRALPLRAEGYAFQRLDIPLWEMAAEGSYSILIRVVCENGRSDTVRHRFDVVDSHRFIDTAVLYEVTTDTQFAAGGPGLTQITFADLGQSQFLNALFGMRHPRGARIEELIMRREANRLMARHFPDIQLFNTPCAFNPLDYQLPSGGIAMLPHASADLAVTVAVMPFILEEVNRPALRGFLQGSLEDPSQHSLRALYGLALLREPVLLHLHAFAQVTDLSVEDATYLALAFAALGDTYTARTIYNERILPHIHAIAPFYRIEAGTRGEILHRTSSVALLAARLGMPQRVGLHNYTIRGFNLSLSTRLNQLAFIAHEIQQVNPQAASITYTLFGQEHTRDLSGWQSFTLRIPTQNLHEFNLTAITGEVGAISTHRVPLTEIETQDADVRITRQFFRAGETTPRTTFDQGDLVRVQITIDYSRTALTGSYMITDFLPAGLVHTPGSARFGRRENNPGRWAWATAEGQRVQFFDFNPQQRRFASERTYYYYARVINPGTFRAEGVIVQHMDAMGYMSIGDCAVIVIR